MMRYFLVLVTLLFHLSILAQPNNKLTTAIRVHRSTLQKLAPYSEEDCSKLFNSRKDLIQLFSHPEINDDDKIKSAYYLLKIQRLILSCNHMDSLQELDTTKQDTYYRYFRQFLAVDTDESEWISKKEEELDYLDYYYSNSYYNHREDSLLDQFFEKDEQREWYYASLRNYRLDSLFFEFNQAFGDSIKLKILQSYKVNSDTCCNSIFSKYACDVINQHIDELVATLNEEKAKLAAQNRKREVWLEKKKEEIAQTKIQLKIADSLYNIGQLENALSIYENVQRVSFDENYASDCIREIHFLMWQSFTYNHFLFDTAGRLRIDTTKSISEQELKWLKDNRNEISAQIIRSLQGVEDSLYRVLFHQSDYTIADLLSYQIKDTTRHLYTIKCDSSGILSIEHRLLSNDKTYGVLADSILRKALPSIFPYLKIDDGEIHEYFIPIIYIPTRYKYTNRVSYYCNCHLLSSRIYQMGITCSYNFNVNTEEIETTTDSKFDEFYFVVTDGQPLSH